MRQPRRSALAEGRCTRCGLRVTLPRGAREHRRGAICCGPVETERPSEAREASGDDWVARAPRGRRAAAAIRLRQPGV
ncbi:MAG: hypothetical protein SF182_20415 [Deltaproteobacteria bacterium]|nr:hypothetical protein [Deltaproteobacteria bacterium]